MQFQVPQFIEVEDKIFGPLTFKQFIYVVGGAGAGYVLWRILPLYIAAPLILGIGMLTVALAFLQYNGRPFINAVEHGFYYLLRTKLYLWSNQTSRKKPVEQMARTAPGYIPKISESKLRELAWSLDIKERIAAGVQNDGETGADSVMDMRGMRTARDALVR
ncbi:MAG: PrgI family protein [bacterium]|nr:PrgI family protein [bacterium]